MMRRIASLVLGGGEITAEMINANFVGLSLVCRCPTATPVRSTALTQSRALSSRSHIPEWDWLYDGLNGDQHTLLQS